MRLGFRSATYTRAAFHMGDGELWLAKIDVPLRFVWTWPDVDLAALDPTSVTVARDSAGRWFVTFHVEQPDPHPLPTSGHVAGVDVGLTDFAVLSTGEKIGHPKDWERHELLVELRLGTRRRTCPACGTRHDRDVNAAKNILAAGLAVTACGGAVRRTGTSLALVPVKQEPRVREPLESVPF